MISKKDALIISLSGFQYGYNTSIMAATVLFLKGFFSLDALQEGWVVSIMILGAVFASCFVGMLADTLGRKKASFLGTCLFLGGVAISTFTSNYPLLLAGRFLIGVGGAIATTIVPMYLIELSSARERGATANFNQIGLASGSLIAYLIGYLFSETGNWRWMFAIGFIPGILQLIGFFSVPDSSYPREDGGKKQESWKGLFHPKYRSRLWILLALSAMQSLIGAPALFYFAPRFFEAAGKQAMHPLLATVWIGVTYLTGIILSSSTIDRLGRRALTLFSTLGMTFSALLIAFCFYANSAWLSVVMIPCVLVSMFCYAVGLGPIPPLVIGEITATPLRGQAMALMGVVGLGLNYFVTLTCPILLDMFNIGGTLALYATFGIGGFIWLLKYLPETKGKSLREIIAEFG